MNFPKTIAFAFSATLLSSAATAGVIPFGIQTNVSDATISSWGWTECHRSSARSWGTATSSVANSCTGDYIMMGAWDASKGAYGVVGAGEANAVTTFTHANYHSDNANGYLDNWSNGLNWYRTEGQGSWGFTTIDQTALNSADILLLNGAYNYHYHAGREAIDNLAKGLSFHANGNGNFGGGWAYNPDGNSWTSLYDYADQRVFWTMTTEVSEPASFAILGLGLMGLGVVRRRMKNQA